MVRNTGGVMNVVLVDPGFFIIPAVNNRKGVELTVRIRWLIIPTMLSICQSLIYLILEHNDEECIDLSDPAYAANLHLLYSKITRRSI